MTKMLRAWIEPKGGRFSIVEESVLFPGYQNRVHETWPGKRGAQAYIKRNANRLVLVEGECPLPVTTAEVKDRYRREVRRRRSVARFEESVR